VSGNTVRAWRSTFARRGVEGVGVIAPGRGRSSWLPASSVEQLIELTLHGRPDGGSSNWTTRTLAAKVGVSKDSVMRIWAGLGLRPLQPGAVKALQDPALERQLVDIAGAYFDPPQRVAIFCSDERSRVQPARQPGDQADRGSELAAALTARLTDTGTGSARRGPGALAAIFRRLDETIPTHVELHALVDALSADDAIEVRSWLGAPRRVRWHLHLMPSGAAWFSVASSWLEQLARRPRGAPGTDSLNHLADAVTSWVDQGPEAPTPFVWVARSLDQ
jgi:transposase